MAAESYPIAAAFAVLLIFLFIVLLITWCCKQFARPKEACITLIPQTVPHHERYISTIDVQTGLPVIVDLSAIASARNQIRILAARRASSPCPINTRRNSTLYGSIARDPPGLTSSCEVLARTPPPPYSEVAAQQPRQ
ncbi:hypothetical protein AVEN_2923-1 [Araneus ventricosus]|uniref:Uncharacterized protein n=1 Tax=Araneus ventricosus TaxID=182803 RepID=A0A4Y2JYN8_ARAVE|nr:hypothetical protein AVEN_2923-1 [Araneus ventricosus]